MRSKVFLSFIVGGLLFVSACGNSSEIDTTSVNNDDSSIVSSPIVDEEALRAQNESSSNSSFLPSEESFIGGNPVETLGNAVIDYNTYVDLDLVEAEPVIVGEEIVVRIGGAAIFFTNNIESWSFDISLNSAESPNVFSKEVPENSKKESALVFYPNEVGNYAVTLKNNKTGVLLEFFVKVV